MIVGVAIHTVSGNVLWLPRPARHPNLSRDYNNEARKGGYYTPLHEGWDADELNRGVQGFIDDAGRFLTRADAEAHARACGQLTSPIIGGVLTSEDLW